MEAGSNKELRDRFFNLTNADFFLDPDNEPVGRYLFKKEWISTDKIEGLEKPGEGNMNLVLRVKPSDSDSIIIKQARPWVEKYPDLEAPVQRIQVEHKYYQYINQFDALKAYSPSILGFDPKNHLMIMEDLGKTNDYSYVYKSDLGFQTAEVRTAIKYLNHLHQLPLPVEFPDNLELRRLNHQHIFYLPFVKDAIDLKNIQPQLTQVARDIRRDQALISRIRELGEVYLSNGNFLLHGDFYPGSLLKSKSGLKVIDPEFAFIGPREWDLAVFTAHLALAGANLKLLLMLHSVYEKGDNFDERLYAGFTGTEVLRRLLGLAQVPVELSGDKKSALVYQAAQWVKTGKIDTLSYYEENFPAYFPDRGRL